ncbi:FimV/HubP family polar landmark protein [Nitrincola sp. MINF-07-Sa-05]|uniref:FimV/HubP family polar landmark protein n=1 Tax=Nitrincola salilacus TaxID=3400273 RepID=UPI003917F187
MLRKLALSLAIAGVLGIPNANALGLGEINIRSALNEPLEAEIRLLQVRDLSPMQIQPRMADVDDFSLAGVTRSRFISDVRFQVNVFPDGTGVIRMTSNEPIREPFLNFLVEVNWPSGRLVREYTLLLDPPVFDPAPVSRPVQPAVSSAPMPAVVVPSPVQSPAPAPAPAPVVSSPAVAPPSNLQSRADAQTQIYVDVRDTMWELALRHRPDSSITPQQMMLALQRKNPGSFPTGNVNMLKAGTVMDIPSSSEIRSLSAQQANAEFARQTELWRQGRAAPRQAVAATPAVDGSREEGKPEAQPEAVTEEVPSELKIVTPPTQEETAAEERAVSTEQSAPDVTDPGEQSALDADAAVEPAEQTEVQEQRIEQIDTRLMMTEESIDMLRRENQDLHEKIDALLGQRQLESRLFELQSKEIADLQAKIAQFEASPPPAATGGGFMESVERFINTVSSIPYIGPILGGILALLLALLFIRKRKASTKEDDPGLIRAPKDLDSGATDSGAVSKAAPVAAVAAAAAVAASEPEEVVPQEEERVVHQPLSGAVDSSDDLSDLDLDMDLDIPEASEMTETAEEDVRVLDEEFDLSADDFDDLDDIDLSSPESVEPEVTAAESDSAESDEEDLISGLGLEDKDDDLDELDFTSTSADSDLEGDDEDKSLTDDVDSLFDLDFDDADDGASEDEGASEVEDEFEAIELSDEDELSEDDGLTDLAPPAAVAASTLAVADEDEELDSDLEGLLAGMDDEDAELLQEELAESDLESADESESEALSLDDDEFDLDDLDDLEGDLENELDQELDADVETVEDDDEDLLGSEGMQLDDVGSDLSDSEGADEDDAEDDFLTAFEFDDIEDHDEATIAVNDALSKEAEVPDADDIDSLLSSLDLEDGDEPVQRKPRPGEVVEEELTANIAHDLELELDSELDDLLNSTDDDIAIEETDASDSEDILEGLGLLDGADENETKLDLARAYIEMDDVEGARDILGEILREGSDQQREEAEELLKSLS